MVQLDGSHHDWFEGRREPCLLLVTVDDATNRGWAQFWEEETTPASDAVLEGWVRKEGLPPSLAEERDSISRCEELENIAEQIAGKLPQTQFGRAKEPVSVELMQAHHAQANRRVERRNGVMQDRLIQALRRAGINEQAAANEFLVRTHLPDHDRRVQVPAASPADAHQAVPRRLDEILRWADEQVGQRDWTVAHAGKWYPLDQPHATTSLAGQPETVRRLRNGSVQLARRGGKLQWREPPGRRVRAEAKRARGERRARWRSRRRTPSVAEAVDQERARGRETAGHRVHVDAFPNSYTPEADRRRRAGAKLRKSCQSAWERALDAPAEFRPHQMQRNS
jgi:hypothetical protein